MKFQSLSLRYKFLIIVGILLSASIFSYLSIAVNLFNDDKKAYIYDGNASLTNSLASESNSVIRNAISSIETIARLVNSGNKGQNKIFADKIFKLNDNIVYIEVYEAGSFFKNSQSSPKYTKAKNSYLEPYNAKRSIYRESLNAKPIDKKALRNSKYLVQSSSDMNVPLMTIASVTNARSGKNDDTVAIAHIRQDRLLSVFSRSDLYSTYLVNNSGEILVSNKNSQEKNFSNVELVGKISSRNIKSSVLSYEKGVDEYILAFSKLDGIGLTVLSEINSDVAFLASKRLVEKSFQFAFLIFFIALVVSIVFTKQLTAALSMLYRGTLKIGQGDFSTKVAVNTQDEIGHLASSFNIMSDKIVSLLEQEKEKAEIEKELMTAQTVQNTFFPHDNKHIGPLTVSGHYQPATQCGGDWWGHIEGPEDTHYILIADAMGHGVSAALVTAMAYSSCQTLAELIKTGSLGSDSPAAILEKFNNVLYNAVEGKISMTFFAMKVDLANAKVTYANAGHNFPILFPTSKTDKRAGRVAKSFQKISERPPVNLNLKGTPLGVTPHCQFEEQSIDLVAGDKFFLFTDGIIECSNPEGEVWGRKTLIKNVLGIIEDGAIQLREKILKQATQFFNGNPIDDDLTVVVVEVDKNYESKEVPAAV